MTIRDWNPNVEIAMNEIAGNWREFECFIWRNEPEEDSEDYAIVYLSNRDSGDLDQSNEHAILESLVEADPEGKDYSTESYNHCLVGHVDGIVIRVRRDGKPTPVFIALHECAMKLADYPVLDEDDWNNRESESADNAWSDFGASDFVSHLAKMPGHKHELDFFKAIPDSILRNVWETLCPSGEWVIHEDSGCYFPFDARFGKRAGMCAAQWSDVRVYLLDAIFEYTRRSKCCHVMPMTRGRGEDAHFVCSRCGARGPWELGETIVPMPDGPRFDGKTDPA